MDSTELLLGGALEGITAENSDIAGSDLLPPCTETFTDDRTQHQQGHNECVITSVWGCVADNTPISYTDTDLNAMRKLLPSYGRDATMGMYLDKGGALVVDYTRSTYNMPLTQARFSTYDGTTFKDTLEMGYSCQIGLRVNSEFYKDVMDNAQINYSVPKNGSGHSIRSIRRSTTNNNYLIDNNKDRLGAKNVIELTPAMFDKRFQNKVFFNNFYVYYVPQTMITDSIKHYQGNTPKEKETVKAREDLVNSKKITPLMIDYEEFQGFVKMVAEITLYRDKNRA